MKKEKKRQRKKELKEKKKGNELIPRQVVPPEVGTESEQMISSTKLHS